MLDGGVMSESYILHWRDHVSAGVRAQKDVNSREPGSLTLSGGDADI